MLRTLLLHCLLMVAGLMSSPQELKAVAQECRHECSRYGRLPWERSESFRKFSRLHPVTLVHVLTHAI
jgi:hypothetical protein